MKIVVGIVCIILFYMLGYYRGYSEQIKRFVVGKKADLQNAFLQDSLKEVQTNNYKLEQYFVNRGMTSIGIYGLGPYYYELLEHFDVSRLKKVYLGDRDSKGKSAVLNQEVYQVNKLVEKDIEAVLVTSIGHFEEIKKEFLVEGAKFPIISYEDLIYNARKEMS